MTAGDDQKADSMSTSNFTPLGRKNLILLIILLTMVFLRSDVILDDMSLGWHLLTGNFILDNWAIPHTDLISYTRAGKPWVPYEWLSGLIMAIVMRLADLPGLVVFTAALIATTWMFLYKRCSEVKDDFGALAFVLTLCGARVAFGLWSARPYTLTYPLVLTLVTCLEKFRRGLLPFRRLCFILAGVTILWTNLHPSFVLGLGIIAVYLISNWLEAAFGRRNKQTGNSQIIDEQGVNEQTIDKRTVDKQAVGREGIDEQTSGQSKSKQLLLLLGICSACTLINPFGYKLHPYLLKLAISWPQQAKLIGESEVYSIFVTGGATGIGFELLVAVGICALAFTRSKPALCQILLFLLLGHVSFTMARAVPIFVLVNLPFISEWVAGIPELNLRNVAWPIAEFLTWWRKISTDTAGSDSRRRLVPAVTAGLLFMIAIVQNSTHAFTLIRAQFSSEKLPTIAARYVIDHRLPEREGLSMYAWGGYLRWFYGIHVFIDDSNEFFDRRAYLIYLRMVNASAGWERTLADNHISWVLCDKKYNLAPALRQLPDWKKVCEDPASELFVRRDRYQLQDIP